MNIELDEIEVHNLSDDTLELCAGGTQELLYSISTRQWTFICLDR